MNDLEITPTPTTEPIQVYVVNPDSVDFSTLEDSNGEIITSLGTLISHVEDIRFYTSSTLDKVSFVAYCTFIIALFEIFRLVKGYFKEV